MSEFDYDTIFDLGESDSDSSADAPEAETEASPETAAEDRPAENRPEETDENGSESDGEGADGESAEERDTDTPGGENPQGTGGGSRYAAAEGSPGADGARLAAEAVDRFIASMNATDASGNPITNLAQWNANRAAGEKQRRAELISRYGLSEEDYDAIIAASPEIAAARRESESARKQQSERELQRQMEALGAVAPEIKTVEDLRKMDTFDQFYNLVSHGADFVTAYKAANVDKLIARRDEAAKQSALNTARSKEHLGKTTSRGGGSVPVPADILAQYRALGIELSEAEITRHYNGYLKNTGSAGK